MRLFSPSKKKLLSNKDLLGKWGQAQSERFLKRLGHRVLTRNFACKTGEIDIITASSDGAVIFVEVKTRANEDYASAESAITASKKQKLVRTARYFVRQHKLEDLPLRFDIVIVVLNEKGRPEIRHYENAFSPYDLKK